MVSRECTHAPVVCVSCLARHIDTSLNGKVFSEIVKCPTCVIVMTYEDIRIGAKEKVFQRQLTIYIFFYPSTPSLCTPASSQQLSPHAPLQATTDSSACNSSKRTPTSVTAKLQAAAAANCTSAASASVLTS